LVTAVLFCTGAAADETAERRQWIADMKTDARGPFQRIRWFCNDGEVLPPKAYACADHGGGVQHGQWSQRTLLLRQDGYYVANLLAGLDPDAWLTGETARDRYAQLLVERFLMGADDGWIFRRALFYRGAIQEEDEREGAQKLLRAMQGDAWWSGPGFPAWRIGAKLLPHGADSASVDRVRQQSASLSDRDPGFRGLRAKIHGAPEAGDAQRVRDYAAGLDEGARAPYLALAGEIDAVYAAAPLDQQLDEFLKSDPPAILRTAVSEARERLDAADSDLARLQAAAMLMAGLFEAIPALDSERWALAALDLSLAVETDFFARAAELRPGLSSMSRRELVAVLEAAGQAAYGAGLVNPRLHGELASALDRLDQNEVSLAAYREVLATLNRVPGWGTQRLRMHFFDAMQTLGELEPMAMRFIQDQLRASPLLLFADALKILSADAGALAGVRHRIFDEEAGTAFTALNPGLARGVLRVKPDLSDVETLAPDGIYVLPETVSDLPPVRGILTAGEGNPLSHVQLLARNLGIPNATVNAQWLDTLAAHDGEAVVLAVSPSGVVELVPDGPMWDEVLATGADEEQDALIRPDLDKLELDEDRFLPLDGLRADDSGRTVGPKAAKLGELRHHYPEAVSNGLAIPFGLFKRQALEQPYGDGTLREWMLGRYEALGPVDPGDPDQARAYEAFRAELYDRLITTPVDGAFREQLLASLREVFGDGDLPGLFIRSDTNVEDLAGFTGAGLNLTLPNVVGEDELLAGIQRVWASPFTARAFAWRQSLMSEPEHVYTSILLLESTPSEKSGVLVTRDIDTGDDGVISVAVNEGVGGAVDGQAAENLRIDRATGEVRVLATATAPTRRVPPAEGGLREVPASGSDTVLQPDEIRQLIAFADSLPERFPPIVDDDGNPAAADVEFGFLDGQLRLFQLRPFLESRYSTGAAHLAAMDEGLADTSRVRVAMNEGPGS
jgi:hypothetical protein